MVSVSPDKNPSCLIVSDCPNEALSQLEKEVGILGGTILSSPRNVKEGLRPGSVVVAFDNELARQTALRALSQSPLIRGPQSSPLFDSSLSPLSLSSSPGRSREEMMGVDIRMLMLCLTVSSLHHDPQWDQPELYARLADWLEPDAPDAQRPVHQLCAQLSKTAQLSPKKSSPVSESARIAQLTRLAHHVIIGMQREGKEWVDILSEETIARIRDVVPSMDTEFHQALDQLEITQVHQTIKTLENAITKNQKLKAKQKEYFNMSSDLIGGASPRKKMSEYQQKIDALSVDLERAQARLSRLQNKSPQESS